MLAKLLLLALVVLPATTQARQPAFSWERLPRFWHAGNASGPLSAALVEFVARKGWASHGPTSESFVIKRADLLTAHAQPHGLHL